MLHTVNKSPFERRTFDSCLRHAKPGSSILLIEDGVYGAMKGSVVSDKISEALDQFKLFALGPDIKARGMDEEHVINGITVVDYGGFVDLVTENERVQSWL